MASTDRGEHKVRLAISLAGLALTGGALAANPASGWATPAVFEIVVIAGGFFGGSAVWSGLKLMRKDD